MKRTILILIAAIMVMLSASCTNGSRNKEEQTTVIPETTATGADTTEDVQDSCITVDAEKGKCVFNNGDITYSWETNEWQYEIRDGLPVLTVVRDGMEISFAILSYKNEMASSLEEYAFEATSSFFGLDSVSVAGHMTAAGMDSRFDKKGYICEKTGFSFLNYFGEDEFGEDRVGVIYAVTDAKRTAVLSVFASGHNEDVKKLFEDNYAGGKDNGLITGYAGDVPDSFEFVK